VYFYLELKMKEKHEDFIKKIDFAEKILDVVKIRELLTPFYKFRKAIRPQEGILSLLQELRPVPRIRGLVDQTIIIALPLLLVYSISCLEHFLSTIKTPKKLWEMIEDWRYKVGEELTRKVHEIRIKRNIIIHSPNQRVDEKSLNNFIHHQITGYKINQVLELTPEGVKYDLDILKKFSKKIVFEESIEELTRL